MAVPNNSCKHLHIVLPISHLVFVFYACLSLSFQASLQDPSLNWCTFLFHDWSLSEQAKYCSKPLQTFSTKWMPLQIWSRKKETREVTIAEAWRIGSPCQDCTLQRHCKFWSGHVGAWICNCLIHLRLPNGSQTALPTIAPEPIVAKKVKSIVP